MKAKKCKIFLLTLFLGILLLGLGYLGLGRLYSQRFAYGTWINGIYCTGMTVAEVNDMLVAQTKVEDIRITDKNGQTSVIKAETVGMNIDYSGQLSRVLAGQNAYLWVTKLQQNFQENRVKPQYMFREDLLQEEIEKSDIVVAANSKTQDIEICLGESGYELRSGVQDTVDVEKLGNAVKEALYEGDFAINLAEYDCYKSVELTEEMRNTIELFRKIEDFQSVGILYDMGDAYVEITPKIAAGWIMLDETGEFMLDDSGELVLRKEGIAEFVEDLAKEFDTYGTTRSFQATRGETVEITGGIYGNKIDREAEISYLTEAFLNNVCELRVPAYEKEAYVRGKNDIGHTYIEIDMKTQKMYYYKDGELLLETDVVTGCVEEDNETPSGVNYVYYKSRNTVLRGRDYESFVKYWMAVKGGIGIHDASWRRKFGGEIYIKNGSHGCINTPESVMKELYNSVEKGTPVVMFY